MFYVYLRRNNNYFPILNSMADFITETERVSARYELNPQV